jgi:hypothetical protein
LSFPILTFFKFVIIPQSTYHPMLNFFN